MTELILAVNSTQAVQGVSAIGREMQDLSKKADEAATRVDELETEVGDLNKQLEFGRRAVGTFSDENRRLKESLTGMQTQLETAAQKTKQFQQAQEEAARKSQLQSELAAKKAKEFQTTATVLTELQSIEGRAKTLGTEIENLGTSFGSTATVGQAFAGVLLDVAQIGDKAKGGFSSFKDLLGSNPLLAAAGVISAIATAMALFSGETKEANVELEKQVKLQEELRQTGIDLAVQIQRNQDLQRIGFAVDPAEERLNRAKQLAQAASSLAGQPGTQSFEDLQRLTGLSYQQLKQRVGPQGTFLPQTNEVIDMGGEQIITGRQVPDYSREAVLNEAARELLLNLAQALRTQAQAIETAPGFTGLLSVEQIRKLQDIQRGARDTGQQFGPPLPPNMPGPYQGSALPTVLEPEGYKSAIGPQPGPDYMTPAQLASYQKQFAPPTVLLDPEKMKQDAEELERFNEKLREMKSLGQDVGAALGGAFFSIVNGAANARQALAALLQSFVAIAQQRAIQGIANSIGNAFGSTVAQNNANAQTPGTANSGTSLRAGTTPP